MAISGTIDTIQFGQADINTDVQGKNIAIYASEKYISNSIDGSDMYSKQHIHIESGENNYNIEYDNDPGIQIVSKNGPTLISSNTYVELNAGTGIVVNNNNYGTSLPTTGNTEGRIFFKLIS